MREHEMDARVFIRTLSSAVDGLRRKLLCLSGCLLLLLSLIQNPAAAAELVRGLGGSSDFGALAMGRNDDGSSAELKLEDGFDNGLNFFGRTFDSLYVNNNGNLTFSGGLGSYTPVPFPIASRPMIAPYWADVDTRAAIPGDPALNNVYYKHLPGKFIVTWNYVGYYGARRDKLDAFQVILADRHDVGPGDFDVEFRYEQLQWTTGDASGGTNGLGGVPAQMGFDAGDRENFYSHPDSQSAAILNLVSGSNVGEPGVWRFEIRNGVVSEPPKNTLKDVVVRLHLPVEGLDIDLASFALPPASNSIVGNERILEWQFATVTAEEAKALDFDAIMLNPVPGEQRTVSYLLTLDYVDVNDDPVHQEIGPQVVTVEPSLYQIEVTTDRTEYAYNDTIVVATELHNLSSSSRIVSVNTAVIDDGGALVADLGTRDSVSLVGQGSSTLSGPNFPTGITYTGDYQIRAILRDAGGSVVGESIAPFRIVADSSAPRVGARVRSNKAEYQPVETMRIQNRVGNDSDNAMLADLTAVTTIYKPDGSELWNERRDFPQLVPHQFETFPYSLALNGTAPGEYRLVLSVRDAAGIERQSDETAFRILSTAATGAGLVAQLTATPDPVLNTEIAHVAATLENHGNAGIVNLPVTVFIADPETGDVVTDWQEIVTSLPVGESVDFNKDWQAVGRLDGTYAVLISVAIGGEEKILANDTFTLRRKTNLSLDTSGSGRILVLLDPGGSNARTAADTSEPSTNAGNDDERVFIETLLDNAGWSYTIVTTGESFAQEFHSGGYAAYALMSAEVKLPGTIGRELREAVFRGEGLLVTGVHDLRNHKVLPALGVKINGKLPNVGGIDVSGDEWLPAGQALFALDENVLKAELQGATEAGSFLTQAGSGSGSLAVASYQYGAGKSVFLGFDALAQAAAAGQDGFVTGVLKHSIEHVLPDENVLSPGRVVPVTLRVANNGGATAGQVLVALPPGLHVMDASDAVQLHENNLDWDFSVGEQTSAELRIWVRLPDNAGQQTVEAQVRLGEAPDFVNDASNVIHLDVIQLPALSQAISELIVMNARPDSVYAKGLRELQQAQDYLAANDPTGAMRSLLKACDWLIEAGEEATAIRQTVGETLRRIAMKR